MGRDQTTDAERERRSQDAAQPTKGTAEKARIMVVAGCECRLLGLSEKRLIAASAANAAATVRLKQQRDVDNAAQRETSPVNWRPNDPPAIPIDCAVTNSHSQDETESAGGHRGSFFILNKFEL